MRIATKIAAGYGVLILLVLGVLTYQMILMGRVQSINQDLSRINLRASIISLQLLRDLDQVEEFTRKYYATADAGYSAQREEMRNGFSQDFQDLLSLPLSEREKQEIDRLSGLWNEFLQVASDNKSVSPQNLQQWEGALTDELAHLNALRFQTGTVIRTTREAIAFQVEQAARASDHAQRISWIAAAATLLLSIGVSYWIVRSISKALKELKEGTEAVAEGKFFYQLDASGNDELASLARDFNTMTQRLGELDQLKKDFISHVSHELKSPLASIRETLRLLLEGIPGPLAPPQRRLLELSLHSGERLSSLIGNLLDLSRIEAGVMEYDIQKRDLCELVRTALAEFEVVAQEHGLEVDAKLPETPVFVECDGNRIIQVISNITGNALKFVPEGSAIHVRLQRLDAMPATISTVWRQKLARLENGDQFLLLSIADSGPGIPDSEKEKIFEKFYQFKPPRAETRSETAPAAASSKAIQQGAGLGLAITRNIVAAHGGAIWVEDNPGGGSIFFVLLAGQSVSAETLSRISTPI
ncbi:MAG: HAMP domain-containing histidine kinase [Acidobacteria bacterium]|nr:HAMP domain-containing histidine kinase [Acidobacteriota bacterium]